MPIALHDLFEQTLSELRHMQLVLERETRDLKGRDAEALEKTIQRKEALADHLNALAGRQEDFLRAQNLPVGKAGIESILRALPPTDSAASGLRAIWQEMERLTMTCRQLNDVNGAYIGLLRQHVQRSLDILHGQCSQDIVYGPDGVGHRPMSSRKLLSV